MEAVGRLDGERLKRAQDSFESQMGQRKKFLMLRLVDPRHRKGQPEQLNQACILCCTLASWLHHWGAHPKAFART